MTVHAAGRPAGPTHIFGNRYQIDIFGWKSCGRRRFLICSRGVVADQAIDFAGIGKIKIGIFPAVTDMTACTAGPIAVQIDAKIINRIAALADIHAFFMANCIG